MENPFVFLSGHCFVLSQRCLVSPLFILGLILPAGAVGFGSAAPVGRTPRDPLITDGLLRMFPFTCPRLSMEYNLLLFLVVRVFNKTIFESVFIDCFVAFAGRLKEPGARSCCRRKDKCLLYS